MISKRKKTVFYIIIFLFPFFFLALLEVALRLVGYGGTYPLVKVEKRFGKERYVVNRMVTKRYFNLPEDIIPEASEEIFDIQKRPNGVRIICLGGSTTAGFPYEVNATFPFQLQYRLRDALLDHYVEVINLGMTAVNSYTVLDLMPEILDLEPDVILIYLGHNEFYGAYGVGSSQYAGQNRQIILFYQKLSQLRLFQILRNGISLLSQPLTIEKDSLSSSLMERMARSKEIPFDSKEVRQAGINFKKNLSAIIQQAQKNDVLVMVSNLISNLKDQKPFISDFSKDLNPFDRQRLQELLLRARQYQVGGEHEKAIDLFYNILKQDSSSADVVYYLGKSFLALGKIQAASIQLSKARDLDLLRFRAPGFFNGIISSLAVENNIPFLDMERVFREATVDSIPGKELFFEHLHPNFDGYRLMAQAFFELLRTVQFINPPQKIGWKENLFQKKNYDSILSTYRNDQGRVTSLDLEIGALKYFFLMNRWPFSEFPVDFSMYRTINSEITANLALQYLKKQISWDQVHYQLADYYISRQDYQKAFEEYRAVNLTFYENYYPHMKIGNLFSLQEKLTVAQNWYDRALNYDPENINILIKLGTNAIFLKQPVNAVNFFQRVILNDQKLSELNTFQKCTFYYLFSLSHANLKNWNEADYYLSKSLEENSEYAPSLKLRLEIQNYLQNEGR
jgi:tetratricopeptide (TPR) repeat protein